MQTRKEVKNSSQELEAVQSDLHSVRTRLDRTPRDDPKFLQYATEEHKIIQEEKTLKENYHLLLDKERETFDRLSASVRESHVKQKAQEEKTKYWSIIGSVIGTIIGIVGSTFISQRRTKDLKNMVNDLKEQITDRDKKTGAELKDILQDFKSISVVSDTGEKSTVNLDDVSKKVLERTRDQLKSQEEAIDKLLKQHEKTMHEELKGIKSAVSLGGTGDVTTFEELLENTGQKLEWEVKMSTLSTVVFVYGAFALTLPVLYNIFK